MSACRIMLSYATGTLTTLPFIFLQNSHSAVGS
jgi:hypothetical protein